MMHMITPGTAIAGTPISRSRLGGIAPVTPFLGAFTPGTC